MNQSHQLIYPTLDLFLYDIKESLGAEEEQININRERFWSKIYGSNLGDKLAKLKLGERNDSDYIELLGDQKIEKFESPLDGYYLPLQMGDTYALQVDATANNNPDDKSLPQSITSLAKLQADILDHIHQQKGTIGQSWLMWGQLAEDNQNATEIAQECFAQLKLATNQNWDTDLKGEGKFLGGTIFELWSPPSPLQPIHEGYHLLICLFPQHIKLEAIQKNMRSLYRELNYLFRSRNKVIWAYSQSREIKVYLKEADKFVQRFAQDIVNYLSHKNINKLQELLKSTPEILLKYTNNLICLDDQRRTIDTNVKNYQKRMQRITALDSQSDWQFLAVFGELATEKYLAQIETDQGNFSPGLTLMENYIKTIQGIIDIEQTKSDRTLSTTIAIAGIGLATSQIATSVILAEIPKGKNPLNYQTLVFFESLGIGLFFAVLTYILLRIFRQLTR